MADVEDLDALSTQELHDRAIQLAARSKDIGFLWDLLRMIPAAEAAAGHLDRGENNILHVTALITDFMRAGSADLGEALRPVYLDYIARRSGRAGSTGR